MKDLSEADDGQYGIEPIITAAKVGRIAWIVWKALNNRNTKNADNTKKMKEITSSGSWEVGSKVKNLNLIAYASYNGGNEVICRDPKTSMKVKVYIKGYENDEIGNIFYNLNNRNKEIYAKVNPEYNEFPINIDGKITNVNNEYAFVTISNAKLNSPDTYHIKDLLHNECIITNFLSEILTNVDNVELKRWTIIMRNLVINFENKDDQIDEDHISRSSKWYDKDFKTYFSNPEIVGYFEKLLNKFADSYTNDLNKEDANKLKNIIDTYKN